LLLGSFDDGDGDGDGMIRNVGKYSRVDPNEAHILSYILWDLEPLLSNDSEMKTTQQPLLNIAIVSSETAS
jgi:hypothetical protein